MEIIKKVCNQEIDKINEKVVDTPGKWNKIEEKMGRTKRK